MCEKNEKHWQGIKAFAPAAIEARVRNVPTKITVAMKDGHSMMFWYMIQRPCPTCEAGAHWEMFDIRWFGVEQEEWIKKYIENSSLALHEVKKLIRKKDVFLEIANRLGIGAVDYVA